MLKFSEIGGQAMLTRAHQSHVMLLRINLTLNTLVSDTIDYRHSAESYTALI